MISRKFARGFIVWIDVAVVLLMFSTSLSGAFYSSSGATSSTSNSNHVYLVTTTIGGQNSSYFEDVQNGKVVKTWPAPATASGSYSSGSSSGASSLSNASSDVGNLSSHANELLGHSTSFSNGSVSKNNSTSSGTSNSGGTFDVTQSYSLASIKLSPSSSNLYMGQTLLLKGTWTGGESPYNYVWRVSLAASYNWFYSSYTNSSTLASSDFNFTPSHPGTYFISLTVSGSGSGLELNASAVISVQNHHSQNYQYSMQNISLTPTTTAMYVGHPITFVGNWTANSPAYYYAWVVTTNQSQWKSYYEGDTNQIDGYNSTTQTSTSFTLNPVYGSYGIFYLYLYVIPSSGYGPDNQQDSLVAFSQIVVLPGTPGVSSVTISPSSVSASSSAGVPIVFTGSWTGGTAPYSYVWMVTSGQTISAPYVLQFSSYNYTSENSASFSFTPSNNGQYYVYLFVSSTTSAAYVMAVSQIESQGFSQPAISQLTLTPTTVDAYLGESLTFNANWVGGMSPYTYVWYVTSNFPYWQQYFYNFNSENVTPLPTAQFTYVPTGYGIYYVYLLVNDYAGYRLAMIATAEIIVLHPSLPLTSSAISISPMVTTVGTPINATVESGYGIAPFTYSWTATTSSGQPATGDYTTSGNQILFNTPGTYTVTVTVTDAQGNSASLTETVTIKALLSVTISISGLASIDSGQSATLILTSVGGGISPYIGQWLEEPPQTSSFSNLTNPFYVSTNDLSGASTSTGILTTTGNWLFEFKVVDSTSAVAYSSPVTITVNPILSVTLISALGTQIDVGSPVTFTNLTQGGTQPYAYSYSVTPSSGWTESTNPGNTFTFNAPGTYTVILTVEDAAGSIVTSSLTITVESPPTVSVQPQSYSIDLGQQFSSLTSSVEYGSGLYTWQWYSGSAGSGTPITGASGMGPSATFLPTQAGSYYVTFKDSTGQSVSSNVAVVTVNTSPTVSVSPSPVTIEASQSVVLTANVNGGSGTFSYSWTLGGNPTVLGSNAEYSFSDSTPGTYQIWVSVTDTGTTPNYVLSPVSVTVTVESNLAVTVSPSSATIDVSQTLTLASIVTGGSSHYSYSWTIGGSTTVVGTSSSYSFSASTPKSYKLWLNVTDTGTNSPYVATGTVSIAVDSSPSILVQPNSVTIDSGQTVSVSSTVSGGTGSFVWQWYDSSGVITGASGSGPTASNAFSTADSGVYVIFTDTGTTTGAAPASTVTSLGISITVDQPLSILTQPSSGIIDSGQSFTLTSTVTGGTGPYSWSLYTSSNSQVAAGSGASISYQVSPTSTTSYYFVFTDMGVTSGATPTASVASGPAVVTVDPALSPAISPSSATLTSGQSQLFTSITSGGTGQYSYAWSIGGSQTIVSTTNSYTFAASTVGTYKLWLNVTDIGTTIPYTLPATATVQVSTAALSVSFSYNTPSSGSGSLDVGQSISLSVTPTISGGVAPYSYQWYLNGASSSSKVGSSAPASSGSAIIYSFTPAGKGAYTFYLTISSSDGLSSTSGAITLTVYARPSISVQPSSTTVDLGQSVTLTSTLIGGTATFSWSLYLSSGTLVTSGTGKTASYVFNAQTNGSYYFIFTDTGIVSGANPSSSAKSNSATITVNSDPTVTVLSTTVGSGSSATLTATAAGGSGTGYSFKWYSDSGLTNLVYSGNPFKTPALTLTTTYYVTVSDSTGTISSPASVTVTVVGSLTSSSLSISPTTTDVGFAITASVSSGSGVAPYAYTWTITLYPSGSASGDYSTSSNHATFTKSGVYSVTVSVKDSAGGTASITKTITVNALPTVTISPSTATIDAGNSVTFSNSSTGGTAPISYGWGYPSGSGITHVGSQFTFANTGNFTIKLYVNDSLGAKSYATSKIYVNSQPIIVYSSLNVTISASATIDSGTSMNIVITSVSGTGPYTAQLKAETPGSTTYSLIATTNQFSTTPMNIGTGTMTTTGQWHFVVVVTEVSNTAIFGTSSPVTVNVVNPPTTSALSISPTTTDIGSPVSVSIQSGYGTAPFAYSWTVTLLGGASASGDYLSSNNQITFSTGGSYSVTATVVDADGLSASISATITVNTALSITISSTTPTIVDNGQTVTFSNSVTGGMAPYTISYSVSSISEGIKFGAYSISGNIITFSLVGQYDVSSTVTDSLGSKASSTNSITVTVNALPTISISPSSATIDTGNSVTFANVTANGTTPYTFIWSYPSSQGITQSGNTFTFADTGNFTITLTIVDDVGVVASSSALITVNPSPIIVLQPGRLTGEQSSSNLSQLNSSFQPLLQGQKKTFSGGTDPSITLDENTPWSVYVQAGTGTPPFDFSWSILYSSNSAVATDYTLGSSNSTYVDNVITFTGTGNYSVTITVVDKYGSTSSESLTVLVNNPLLVVTATIQATVTSFDLGNSTTLSSTPTISGGTKPYSFQWYRNGTASGDKISGQSGSVTSGQSLTLPQTPTVPGNYTYYLVISDSAYSPASNSTALLITVNRIPTPAAIIISPTSTTIDGLINATIKPGNGTAPFNYTWTVAPENGSSSPVSYYGRQIGLNVAGNYTVSLKVKDADGKVAYNNTTVKIYSGTLVTVRITSPPSVPSVDVGQSQVITGTFGGGSGSYEYQWVIQTSSTSSAPSSGYTSGTSPQSYTFTSTASGTFYVFLYVRDTIVGDTGHVYQEVKVNNDISQTSISISPTTTSVGVPVVASLSSGYGTAPFTYSWVVTLSNGGSATGDYNISGDQVTFSKSGNYTAKVTISDSYSSATSSSYNIDVSGIVSLTASISSYPTAGVTAMDIKHGQVFQAIVLGGGGSYSYSWGIGGTSGVVGASSTYTLNVSTPGLYIIWLNVTEGTSHASATPMTIVVNPLPKAFFGVTGTIQADVGQWVQGTVAGGTPPYHYSWVVAVDPTGGSAAGDYTISGTSIAFNTRGNYTVEFIASDADGAISSVTVTFVVNYQMSGSLSLTNPLSSVIDRGNSSLLNVSITGGSGSFSYQWLEQTPGSNSFHVLVGAVNSTFDFVTSSLTTPGIYLFYVNVTDINTDPAYVHSNIISVNVLAKVIYGVTFSETGLPLGTKWFVNITNGDTYSSVSNNMTFLEPNGTYSYAISTGDKTYKLSSQSVSSFSFTISGNTISQPLVFLPVVYSVTFSEYGLKTGTEWFVNLSDGQSYSSTLGVISFSMSNGTFPYTIATVNKQYRPEQFSSSLTIDGSSVSNSVQFFLVNYSVTFNQSKLPVGVKWFVNLSGGQTYNSTSSSLSFLEPNGTYSYLIGTSDKVYFSLGGTFTVTGTSVFEHITFSPFLYNISFVEMGLPSGMKWNVTLLSTYGNVTESSAGSIFFNEVNGTYNFNIRDISGYTTQNYLITIVVEGSSFRNLVTWTAVTYPVTITETGLAQGATWSITLTTIQEGQQKVVTLNTTSDSITFNVTNGSYSYTVTLPQGYAGSPVKSTISVVGSAVTTKLEITALPNYTLISIVAAIAAVVIVVLALYIAGTKKSLFKREGRFLKLGHTKGKK